MARAHVHDIACVNKHGDIVCGSSGKGLTTAQAEALRTVLNRGGLPAGQTHMGRKRKGMINQILARNLLKLGLLEIVSIAPRPHDYPTPELARGQHRDKFPRRKAAHERRMAALMPYYFVTAAGAQRLRGI